MPASIGERRPPFEEIADGIMYRWTVERDVWVSATEVEEARAYLAREGIATAAPADSRTGTPTEDETLEAARLVLIGLKHLHRARRGGSLHRGR